MNRGTKTLLWTVLTVLVAAVVIWLSLGDDDTGDVEEDSLAGEAAEIRAQRAAREAAEQAEAEERLAALREADEGEDIDDGPVEEDGEFRFPPSFSHRFRGPGGDLWSMSSPQIVDLNGDGAMDIVFGTGYERQPADHGKPDGGFVFAISGATNRTIWEVGVPGEIYSTPKFIDVDDKGQMDVIVGGREGVFVALSGEDGELLWAVDPEAIAEQERPYNFYTPAVIDDIDGDGVADLVVTYGGDDQKAPYQERNHSYIALISGATGDVIRRYRTPDRNETYCSPVVYTGADGRPWVAFGTGGETHEGSAWRAPLSSLQDGSFPRVVEEIVEPTTHKGVIAPINAADITGDGHQDLIVRPFDGRTILIEGRSGRPLWTHEPEEQESYHGPALAVLDDGELGLLVSNGTGIFPAYTGTSHYLLRASDGEVLWSHEDDLSPVGAPVSVDLTGDGIDEILFFSGANMFRRAMTRIHVLRTSELELSTHEQSLSILATPILADLDDRGRLELVVPGSRMEPGQRPSPESVSWRLLRLELDADTPERRTWAGYMGTDASGVFSADIE